MATTAKKSISKPERCGDRAKSDAFEAIHSAAAALLEVGAIDRKTMRLFDASCLTPPNMTAKDVKRIRAKLRVSQEVLAKSIGATKSTIAKWESGINTPSAMAQQLLRVIDRHSLSILD